MLNLAKASNEIEASYEADAIMFRELLCPKRLTPGLMAAACQQHRMSSRLIGGNLSAASGETWASKIESERPAGEESSGGNNY